MLRSVPFTERISSSGAKVGSVGKEIVNGFNFTYLHKKPIHPGPFGSCAFCGLCQLLHGHFSSVPEIFARHSRWAEVLEQGKKSRCHSGESNAKIRAVTVRKIIHVDMDAFYASVEQRDDPNLRGKPVIVAWRGNRSVVCAASYEARKFGVHSAMPAVRAERLCPDAVFVSPDFTRYRAVSRQVREILQRHTDLIEPLSLDEAYLDVTENKTGLPTATRVAIAIRKQIREELNLTASAGVAPNKFLAKIASDWKKPDGLFVIQPEEVDSFLLPLSVGRIPGVGKVTQKHLEQIGVKTIAQLRSLELSLLEEHFGRYGHRLYELARGIDLSPVISDRPTKSISAEDTFERDMTLDETGEIIRRLAERVWSASRKDARPARTVVLKLKTAEFRILTRSHTLTGPLASCEELTSIALSLRERVGLGPEQRFRLVGVGLHNFRDPEDPQEQPALFDA